MQGIDQTEYQANHNFPLRFVKYFKLLIYFQAEPIQSVI